MLYQSLKTRFENNPEAKDTKMYLQQYEKQREHFLEKRLGKIRDIYHLKPKELKILIAYFNTSERDHSSKRGGDPEKYRILSVFKYQKPKEDFVDDNPINGPFLGWLKIYWSDAWREFAEDNKFILAARFAVLRLSKNQEDQSFLDSAVEDLSSDLKEILPKAEKFIGLPLTDEFLMNPSINKDGFLKQDVKKLKWLLQNNIGKNFKSYIAAFKKLLECDSYSINKRIDVWDNPLYFARELAQLRWKDRIEDFVKRKRDNPPALTFSFASQISRTISKKTKISKDGKKLLDANGNQISSFDPSACMNLVTAENILGRNIAPLSSKVADHMIRWIARESNKQHILNLKDPNIINLEGGWGRLGELSGAGTTNKTIEKLKLATAALAGCGYEYESDEGVITGNLLSYEHIQARGRRSSKLKLMLSRPLCPGFVHDLSKGCKRNKRERFLIPVVDMPIFVGEAKTYASQSNFQWHLIIEMRLRAVEIYQRGGILLSNDDKMSLARKARLSVDMVEEVFNAWVSENYLERIDEYVYFLGSRYPDAQRMIKEAGEDQVLGAEAGRKINKAKKLRFKKIGLK